MNSLLMCGSLGNHHSLCCFLQTPCYALCQFPSQYPSSTVHFLCLLQYSCGTLLHGDQVLVWPRSTIINTQIYGKHITVKNVSSCFLEEIVYY